MLTVRSRQGTRAEGAPDSTQGPVNETIDVVVDQMLSDDELFVAAACLSPAVTCLRKDEDDRFSSSFTENSNGHQPNDEKTAGFENAWQADDGEQQPSPLLQLPDELLRQICSHIPVRQLYVDVSAVNRRFRTLISCRAFLRWPKMYERYRHNDQAALCYATKVFVPVFSRGGPQKCLANLIDHVHQFLPLVKLSEENMQLLKHHVLFPQARAFFQRVRPKSFWSFVTVMLLICDNVLSISHLMNIMLKMKFLSINHVIDYFHLMALSLLIFHEKFFLPPKLHYDVMYALDVFYRPQPTHSNVMAKIDHLHVTDNQQSAQTCCAAVRAEVLSQLTDEQLRIVNSDFRPTDTVRVLAFAGTGKSSVLLNYVRLRPSMRFLVIFYNKCLCDKAKEKFPANATCRTMHSLAFEKVGVRYKHKLASSLSLGEIVSTLGPKVERHQAYAIASQVRWTLVQYLASSDHDISVDHAPKFWGFGNGTALLSATHRLLLVELTTHLWKAMKSTADSRVHMLHDGYLKLYQLQGITLNYDCIMVDEAQDCNPATVDVVLRQSCAKIFVGDSYQQIYGFRGAVDALKTIPCTHTFYLTHSFRFGSKIAFMVNCWLQHVCGERRHYVTGSNQPSYVDGRLVGQVGVIARFNSSVFNECVRITEMNPRPRLAVVGRVGEDFSDFDAIEDIYTLMLAKECSVAESRQIKSPFIARFKTLTALEDMAKRTMDFAVMSKINIVRKHGFSIPAYVERIKSCLVQDMTTADYVVMTAHQSKGLEFPTVQLAPDLVAPVDDGGVYMGDSSIRNERNLVYVAMSRAKSSLIINDGMMVTMRQCGEYFESIVLDPLTYGPLEHCMPTVCAMCYRVVEEDQACLFQQQIAVYSETTPNEVLNLSAVRCLKCAFDSDIRTAYGTTTSSVLDRIPFNVRRPRSHVKELFSAGGYV